MMHIQITHIRKVTNVYCLDLSMNRNGILSGVTICVPNLEVETVFNGIQTLLERCKQHEEVMADLNKALGDKTWE